MGNIHNFANRQMCEYVSIFPSAASLLDHVLFTNGNGYKFNRKTGMIVDGAGLGIDQYPEMQDTDWDELIARCHEKERSFASRYPTTRQEDLDEDCAKYKRVSVTDKTFGEDSLYEQIQNYAHQKKLAAIEQNRYPSFVRPYPLSKGYAIVFNLNERTPSWLLQIAFNACKAWVRFLDNEIEYKNVWVPHSERPAIKHDEDTQEALKEVFDMIKADSNYDGWLDRPLPTSDYADLKYTTEVRDTLAGQVQRLGKLLIASSKFSIGDKVVVSIRDPYHTYSGCAEPMPGMEGTVIALKIEEPEALGRIAVKFDPAVLGYEYTEECPFEDTVEDNYITLYLRPWILAKK